MRNAAKLRQVIAQPDTREHIAELLMGDGAQRRKRQVAAEEIASMEVTIRLRADDDNN